MLIYDLAKRFFIKKKARRAIRNNKNFYQDLQKPFLVLAPMDDVTDFAFRQMFARFGKNKLLAPLVMFTEFVSADGLSFADDKNLRKIMTKLKYAENERPVVAQIFGSRIDTLKKAAKLVQDLGFDGLDINMGCPDKSVEKTGSGADLIKHPEKALKIIEELKSVLDIPLSVKSRIGYNKIDLEWVSMLFSSSADLVTLHLRTRKEMSKVPAHWELVEEIIQIKNKFGKEKLFVANGDIKSAKEAIDKAEEFGLDGIMIGRGVFGNPRFFEGAELSKKEKLELLLEHLKIYKNEILGTKPYATMKKHFKAYISDFDSASLIRKRLMETESIDEAIDILSKEVNL